MKVRMPPLSFNGPRYSYTFTRNVISETITNLHNKTLAHISE